MGENKTKNMDSTYFGRQRTILKAFFFTLYVSRSCYACKDSWWPVSYRN